MNKHKDLVKNTLTIAVGKISTQFLSFLLLPLYTSYLTTTDFGTVDLLMTYVMLLAPILTIQLEMASFRYLVDAREDEQQKRTIISNAVQLVILSIVIFSLLYLILSLFIHILYANLIFCTILSVIASSLFLQFARGLGNNKQFAIGSIVAGVTTIVANIILIVGYSMGARGMLTAMMLANIVCTLYLFFALKMHKYIRISNKDNKLRKQLIGYSAPLVPNGVAWWLINAADRTIIALFLGVAANGIFAVAYKFPLVFSGLFSFFGMSWTESASMHINSKDRDMFFSQTMNASVRFFGSLALGIIAFVPLIFDHLVNIKYNDAYTYIPILIIGSFFNSIVGLYSAIYIAKKMTKQVASSSIVSAIISISFTLIFVHYIGLYAAAFAMAIAFLAMAIYRHYDIKKYMTIRYEKKTFFVLAVLSIITMILYYYNNQLINIANALFITIALIVLNKSLIRIIKKGLFSKLKPLTPDQQIEESKGNLHE